MVSQNTHPRDFRKAEQNSFHFPTWNPKKLTRRVFIVAQGSYHCGGCKSGFTGDQVKGCKPEISCGNSLTNPCDVNAQCIVERDGSVSCQVGFHTTNALHPHALHIRTHTTPHTLCPCFEEFPFPRQCGIGWAGNGYLCGKDTDIDGYPDEKLRCKDMNCRRVMKAQIIATLLGLIFFLSSL